MENEGRKEMKLCEFFSQQAFPYIANQGDWFLLCNVGALVTLCLYYQNVVGSSHDMTIFFMVNFFFKTIDFDFNPWLNQFFCSILLPTQFVNDSGSYFILITDSHYPRITYPINNSIWTTNNSWTTKWFWTRKRHNVWDCSNRHCRSTSRQTLIPSISISQFFYEQENTQNKHTMTWLLIQTSFASMKMREKRIRRMKIIFLKQKWLKKLNKYISIILTVPFRKCKFKLWVLWDAT
jgi:hypothetical protein